MSLKALAPIAPVHLKAILELHGYSVIAEDSYNWVFARSHDDVPLIVPMLGDMVSLEVLMDIVFTKAGMDLRTYLALRGKAHYPVN